MVLDPTPAEDQQLEHLSLWTTFQAEIVLKNPIFTLYGQLAQGLNLRILGKPLRKKRLEWKFFKLTLSEAPLPRRSLWHVRVSDSCK